ncbi:putative two component signal transduction histidine kinase [Synechococcus sp. BIOS-U3-1]|nr:putative two component signal transduction histidine kinase [Synechococcus sp. BIOS-U3-1]
MPVRGKAIKTSSDPLKDSTPLLQSIQACMATGVPTGQASDTNARRLWWGGLEVLQDLLEIQDNTATGIWLAAPLPALYAPGLLQRFQGWVWAPEALDVLSAAERSTLLPLDRFNVRETPLATSNEHFQRLPLRESDSHDPLLIVITSRLQVALALNGEEGQRQLLMRSEPDILGQALTLVEQRLRLDAPEQADVLQQAVRQLGPLQSSSDLATRFWPCLAERLAGMAPTVMLQTAQASKAPSPPQQPENSQGDEDAELSLLEAITHEVRTPLATIRTLIRSLLRRRDLPQQVLGRLQQIDTECSEQIDRFGLIFQAAELQRQPHRSSALARTDLGAMLNLLAPGWEQQLQRRGLHLKLNLESGLPPVLSDPGRLEPMLGGLIDRCSRSLPAGSSLDLTLQPAGARLKLQILTKTPDQLSTSVADDDHLSQERLGPVLSWNTSTGGLQLSQTATRRLLERLGGRLTQRRDRGLTVFFPIADHC